jgi:pimeloyl-ACP methyl ester carboxylesterase
MRIPGTLIETKSNKSFKPLKKKAAVLLQHGLEIDASEWVINSPDRAPAFILATQGYDVWMGNNRGCQYSLKHKTLNSTYGSADAGLYWSFSFEEMGLYDIPAEIDFILRATGQK